MTPRVPWNVCRPSRYKFQVKKEDNTAIDKRDLRTKTKIGVDVFKLIKDDSF